MIGLFKPKLGASDYSGEFGIENKVNRRLEVGNVPLEAEIDLAKLAETIPDCIQSVRDGHNHLVLDDGTPVAAVVSMPDYIQLSRLKALIEKAAEKLLQGDSLVESSQSDSTGKANEGKGQTRTSGS